MKLEARRPATSFALLAPACVLFAACGIFRGPLPEGEALDEELRRPPLTPHLRRATAPVASELRPVRIDPSDGLSPDEAALIAVAVNPSLQAVRDNRGIARSQVIQAGILPNPQVSAQVEAPTDGPTNGTSVAYAVGLSWNLTPLLSVGTAVEAAERQLESVQLDIAWQEWQVAQSARLHAGRLVFIERRLALAEQSVQAFRAQVDVIQRALGEGNATILTLSTAQSAMQTASVTRLRVLQERRVARLQLLAALGVPPTVDLGVDANAPLPTWTHLPALESILAELPERRFDLQALRQGYASQDARIRTAVLRQFPPLSVGVVRSAGTGGLGVVGFNVTIGLPAFNRNQGRVALAEATQSQLYDQYLGRVQSARFEVAQALANLTSVREQIAVLQQAVPTLEHLLELARQQAGEGNVSLVDLYDLRVRLLTRQLALQQLLQSELELGVSLDLAAGRILADPPEGS